MNILYNTLDTINAILNDNEANTLNFYKKIIEQIKPLYKNCTLGIFFLENLTCETKAVLKNDGLIDTDYKFINENLETFIESNKQYKLLKTQKDIFLNTNTLITKLMIKNSIFGFCILSSNNEITDELTASFLALTNILSYKIKDYELKEIYKMQLKAIQDATIEKDQAYTLIKKQHKKLIELDRVKNTFLANISHELRTPLNAIIGFSQALDSQIFGTLNPKQAEYIKDIQISSLHLLGMINEILDISKLESNAMKFSPDEIDPDIIIKETIKILEPLYTNKNIQVIYKSDFNGKIIADYQKFRQILFNLLSNAIKFTQNDGKIEIAQSCNNKDYLLKIKDNGIGIEKKYHNKIFKKYVQVNNINTKNESSTGLGLTITKELVKLHKGKITLESELNKGSCFNMEFKKIIV